MIRLKFAQIRYIKGENWLKNDQNWAKNGQNRVIFADFLRKKDKIR